MMNKATSHIWLVMIEGKQMPAKSGKSVDPESGTPQARNIIRSDP
jgi:hypothetical protein